LNKHRIGQANQRRPVRLRIRWTRHRCQLEPPSTLRMASFSPSCASLMTSSTSFRPRRTKLRRNSVQKGPSSLKPTSKPSTSRSPVSLTPTATTSAMLSTRPPREIAYLPQFRDAEVDGAHPRLPSTLTVAVAMRHTLRRPLVTVRTDLAAHLDLHQQLNEPLQRVAEKVGAGSPLVKQLLKCHSKVSGHGWVPP